MYVCVCMCVSVCVCVCVCVCVLCVCAYAGFHTGFLAWGGKSIGASMKRGNVRGGVGASPFLPPPSPNP